MTVTLYVTGPPKVTVENRTINMEKKLNQIQKMQYSHHLDRTSGSSQSKWSIQNEEKSNIEVDHMIQQLAPSNQLRQQGGLTWPFANYFPIVINDPFLTAYNAITSSMYNTFSSMIEYGPEADICRSKTHSHEKSSAKTRDETSASGSDFDEVKVNAEVKLVQPEEKKKDTGTQAQDPTGVRSRRKRRNATNIFVKYKDEEMVGMTLEEPDARR